MGQTIVFLFYCLISLSLSFSLSRTPGTGLYDNLKQYRVPEPSAIFDITYFSCNPKPFFTLAKELYPGAKYSPNTAHYFIRLLQDKGLLQRNYTQNIDGLERCKKTLVHTCTCIMYNVVHSRVALFVCNSTCTGMYM